MTAARNARKTKRFPLRIPRLFAARDFRNNELYPSLSSVEDGDCPCVAAHATFIGNCAKEKLPAHEDRRMDYPEQDC
jgi:hypothetical protein